MFVIQKVAFILEEQIIKQYNSTNKKIGYNVRPGGSVSNPSAETRQKMSQSANGKLGTNKNKKFSIYN